MVQSGDSVGPGAAVAADACALGARTQPRCCRTLREGVGKWNQACFLCFRKASGRQGQRVWWPGHRLLQHTAPLAGLCLKATTHPADPSDLGGGSPRLGACRVVRPWT